MLEFDVIVLIRRRSRPGRPLSALMLLRLLEVELLRLSLFFLPEATATGALEAAINVGLAAAGEDVHPVGHRSTVALVRELRP